MMNLWPNTEPNELGIESTQSSRPLLLVKQSINLAEKELAKDVPKRGAPTKAKRKRKAKTQSITSQKSKFPKVSESNTEINQFISNVIINNPNDNVNKFVSKNKLIDEEYIQVNSQLILTTILQSSFIDSNGLKKDHLVEYFTSDGLMMLKNTIKIFLNFFKSCKICYFLWFKIYFMW